MPSVTFPSLNDAKCVFEGHIVALPLLERGGMDFIRGELLSKNKVACETLVYMTV